MTATAGIVLTGGRSRRLGVDKATLVLDGETLARRTARSRLAAAPGMQNTPQGNAALLDVLDAVADRQLVRASEAETWRQTHGLALEREVRDLETSRGRRPPARSARSGAGLC